MKLNVAAKTDFDYAAFTVNGKNRLGKFVDVAAVGSVLTAIALDCSLGINAGLAGTNHLESDGHLLGTPNPAVVGFGNKCSIGSIGTNGNCATNPIQLADA